MDSCSEILNLNKVYNIKEEERLISYLPSTFRCIVAGVSGCGKTNLILNILLKLFESYKNINTKVKLFICSKSLSQNLYLKFIEDIENKYNDFHKIITSDKISDAFPAETFINNVDTNYKNIILIDDMLGIDNKKDKSSLIQLFTVSRPKKISLFFLTQRFNQINKTCRSQANYLITFKPSFDDAMDICKDLLGGMTTPSILLDSFSDNTPYYCLFCDKDKNQILSIYDIFKKSNHLFYKSIGEYIDRLFLLDAEKRSGNDNGDIYIEMVDILFKLDKFEIIKVKKDIK